MAPYRNPFRNERVVQGFYYPRGWFVPMLSQQKDVLTSIMGTTDIAIHAFDERSHITAEHADGIALIPKVLWFGHIWGINDPYGRGYNQIVAGLISLIGKSRWFPYCLDLSRNGIRLHPQVKRLLMQLEENLPGDVMTLPISLGNHYAGYSPRHARCESLHCSQLPLGVVQVGFLLLTMRKRLVTSNQLSVNCPGDVCDRDNNGQRHYCPCYSVNDGGLHLGMSSMGLPSRASGSAVAFL